LIFLNTKQYRKIVFTFGGAELLVLYCKKEHKIKRNSTIVSHGEDYNNIAPMGKNNSKKQI
jgi:hypothetical protein